MPRYARKKDTAHAPITDGLEASGKVVFDVSACPGLGFDIVVYDPVSNKFLPMEVKSDKTIHHRSATTRLRPSQVRALALAPIAVVETLEEALRCFRS